MVTLDEFDPKTPSSRSVASLFDPGSQCQEGHLGLYAGSFASMGALIHPISRRW